jgi:hypothetical protein
MTVGFHADLCFAVDRSGAAQQLHTSWGHESRSCVHGCGGHGCNTGRLRRAIQLSVFGRCVSPVTLTT